MTKKFFLFILVVFIILFFSSCSLNNSNKTSISDGGIIINVEGLNPANIPEERLNNDKEFKENYEACISWWLVYKHTGIFICKIGKACFTGDEEKMKEMPMWWCWLKRYFYFGNGKFEI